MTTEVMGPLPAAVNCLCRICLPETAEERLAGDAVDRSCIDTVLRCGWQVMLVGSGGCSCCDGGAADDTGPAFAYTVGLAHRAGHPELAMSGLDGRVMHHALNVVAEQVLRGHRVFPGDVIEGALGFVPVTVDQVSDAGLQEIGIWSSWFHRAPVGALQLVWPTTSGVFAWQPGAPAELDASQPPPWRTPSARLGALAADPPWPLPIEPDALMTVCDHVCTRGAPVLSVSRRPGSGPGGQWIVHCGQRAHPATDMTGEHASHLVRGAPSLRELADLPVGRSATRDDTFSPWRLTNG